MKKIIFSFFLYCFTPFFLMAQYDDQTSILTDDGIFTVSQTDEGQDMISFHILLWDNMQKGTKYTSGNLVLLQSRRVCIQIANKDQMFCKTGIGFRCGIFDCISEIKNTASPVNASNRICSAMIQKTDAVTIKIIFLDKVDWFNLQNEH